MNTDKKRRSRLAKVYTVKIREDIAKMIERANHFALPERQVTLQTAVEVANRDLRRTLDMHPDRRAFSALKAVSAHIALATNNKYTSASLSNSDLLPIGHPMSTATHAMTSSALAHAQARWIAADRLIADDVRALVASAYSLEPESIERRHAFARLAATPTTSVPRLYTLDPITAAFGFGTGGDSKAARSLRAQLQRRDRYGRFAFMGGGFSFNLRGLDGTFSKFGGRVVGAGDNNTVQVEVKDHPTIPNGIYSLPASKGVSSKAWLPESVEVKDSKSSTDLFVDESDLQKLDAPSGWDKQPTEAGAPELWTSKDGYFVQKDGDTLSLHRADLEDNSIGDEVASSDSWADIQKAALNDQDDYAKVLEDSDAAGGPVETTPASVGELGPGEAPEGWTTTVSATQGGEAKSWNHVSPDGLYSITETRQDMFGPNAGKPAAETPPRFDVWRRREGGGSDGQVSGRETTWDDAIATIETDRPKRAAEPAQKAAKEEEFRKKVEEANKPSTAEPVELDYTKDIKTQLRQIAKDKGRVKFKYNGKERVVEPKDVFVNKYNGNLTLLTRGRDGKDISYLVDKIEVPYVPPVELTPEQKRANLISRIKRDIRDSFVPDPTAKYADRIFPGPAGAKTRDTVKAEIAKANLTEAEKQDIIDWGITRGDGRKDDTLRPFYESFFEGTVSAPEPEAPVAPVAPAVPEAQAPNVIDFDPAGKIEDGRKFIADAKANKQKIRFMYNGKERVVDPQEIWINGQTGRINLRAIDSDGTKKNFSLDKITAPEPAEAPEEAPSVQPNNSISKGDGVSISFPLADYEDDPESFADSVQRANDLGGFIEIDTTPTLDGANAIVVTFDKPRLTEEEANEFLGSEDEDGAFDARFSSDEDERDELFDALTGGQFEPTPEPAEAPEFISPEAGREVLDDGLSTVNAALGDIPDEDLDNLDEEDSEAITKVGDLLDSAQDAIDKIDPVGSSTNDLHFEQARADLGEAAQILSEANNGDMQNAGFDLKEAVDNFIALPQIDFGGGRAERSAAETPVQDTTPDGVMPMDSILTEEFDSMFDTPDGSYKPDIFGYYEPKGRTVEDSANYTDDPEVLAGMFSPQELVLALRDAVLPIDGEDAPGRGALEFSDGPEFVPAEALYHAIEKSGDGDLALANIYDMDLDPNREMTNAERISMFKEDALIDPLGGNEITKPTTRDAEVLKAVDRNKEIGKPTKAQVATDLMLEHDEQNQSVITLADDLIAKQDDGLGYDSFNLQDTLVQYLPWSVSNDPNEREAFKGLWGMMMSLDGGSSNEDITPESLADPEAFRTIIYNSLLEIHGGDDTVAIDAYNELVDNFGGMPEFVAGKDAIASGKDDLSSDTTAAAFYRLVATSSRPNQTSLYRSIAVKNNDPLLEKYTTEGSLFGMDARSFTSTNITDGSLSSKLFYPAGSGESRIIFEVAPGETKSIDASTISWFAGENEHFSFGNFEVLSVKKQQGLGGNPEYVVKVRNTDTKEVAAPIAEGISYSGIEDWKKVGGQMGSNVGGTFEDPNGNQYYVKIPKSPSHAQNESLASALYREAGIDAVEVNLGFSDGELRTISPLVPNSSTDLQTKLDDPEYIKKLQEGFAVDAWLANWDVAGLTFDNVITDGNGNPVRVDPGGALMWRAQGAPKGKLFGDKVNEIDSLRDPDLNPTSSEVFGSMTDEDISNSAAKLAGITPERIDSIVDSIVTDPDEAATLKDRLKKRRDDILRRFTPKDKILNESTPLPLEEDPNAPQPPSDPNDVNAMNEYKGALADYEINKVVSDVWDCPPGGLTAAGDKTCTTPSVDDLIDNVISKADAVGVADNTATEKKILDDIINFIDDIQEENLKPSTKKKAREIAEEITAIREGLKDGSITNDQAIARLNTLSDSIPVGGTSADADTLEVIAETIDDYRRILDGSFEDRPMSDSYPPAGSGGKGYAKDKTTFLKLGMRVRNKWGYAGTVDRYDKNSWQVWVTMDIDPSGQFAPGYKKMSFSTKTLDAIQEGGDDSPWIDLPGTPEGKKPKTGVTPTKVPPKGSPAEKYSKEVADKIAKSGKAAKPPKAEAPEGAPEAPEDLNNEIDTGTLKSETPSTISKAEKATGAYEKEHPGSRIYTDSRGGKLWFSVKKGQLGEKRVFIHAVLVDENSRRQGIGADLLDKLANDYFGSQISPGGLTEDGEPFWNWWADSRGLAELSDPQFPNSRYLMTDEQLAARNADESVDGSNFPYTVTPSTEAPKAEAEAEAEAAPEPSSIPEPIAKFSKGKVTGTGAKKIVVENPPPFEYSAFDEVPSMRGALDSLTDENVKFAKVRGASAAFDGGDIEDLEVRVEGIIDEERKESTRISYKLTSWAGDDLVKSIDAGDGEWDATSGVSIPRTSVDEETGAILIKAPRGSDAVTAYSNMGKTYVADTGNGIKVTLRRTPDTASALHNYVTIDMPYGTTDEEIARAMSIAGVTDPRPATTTDFRILAENRLMSIFSGNTNAESNIKVATNRETRLMDIEKKYGITPDDVKIRVGTSGQIETIIPEEVGKKIAEMTGADTLEHDFALHSFAKLEAERRGMEFNNLSAADRETAIIDGLIDFFVGPRGGGLVGTRARYFTGMQIQGMSSTSDLGTGGADYVFLRPSNGGSRHKSGVYGEFGAELAFDAAKAYTRLDWYANESDKYGRRAKRTDVIKNAKLGAYEVMFKKRLGLESLRSLALNEDFREKVLTEFTKRGITEINGRPIDEVIVIAGRPGDPSGKFEKASKPLTEKLENLGAYGVGMSDVTPGLNTLIGTKFLYPPWDTKAYAISTDMKKVIVKNNSNQYMIYTSDGQQSIIDDSNMPDVIDSIGSPSSEYSLFFKNEIDYGMTAVANIVAKYASGDATPEETARALMTMMKQAPSYSTLISIKNAINSKLDLANAWKKIKEEL